MPIVLKSKEEIALMREAGRAVAQVLEILRKEIKPGLVGKKLDDIVQREFARRGVTPTFLGYHGYPARVCVSVNDEVVHGIPNSRLLQEGDVVSIDLGATYKGFVGDAAVTVCVGQVSPEAASLVRITEEALWEGIRAARTGARLGEVSAAVQAHAEQNGFAVVREYVGHGIGREMHEEPQVPNFGRPEQGPLLQKGMVLAIEPMVTAGDWRTKRDSDNWTVRTLDGSLAAHFEHTIAITEDEAEVLTLP
jgi:methionyl aminopeptidase